MLLVSFELGKRYMSTYGTQASSKWTRIKASTGKHTTINSATARTYFD